MDITYDARIPPEQSQVINKVIYGTDNEYLEKESSFLTLNDGGSDFWVHRTDIPNLIKALQKAISLGWHLV
jgi:hypothetical protein